MRIDRDLDLLSEAYKKVNESNLPTISPAHNQEVRHTNKEGKPFVEYALNGKAKSVFFYYDERGNFERGLIKGNGDLQTFRLQDVANIASQCRIPLESFEGAIKDGAEKVRRYYDSSTQSASL